MWVRNGASAVLLAAGTCAFCARGVCADTPSTERLLAPATRPGELPTVPSVRSRKALTVLGGALPGLPEQGPPGLPVLWPDERSGAMVAAPDVLSAGDGPARVLPAGSALTFLPAVGAVLFGLRPGRARPHPRGRRCRRRGGWNGWNARRARGG